MTRPPTGLAELDEDGLLGLGDGVDGREQHEERDEGGRDDGQGRLHWLPPPSRLAVELEQRQDALGLLVEDRSSCPSLGISCAHGLEVDALARHRRGLPVLLVEGVEALGVALGVVDALEGVALGRAHRLLGLALGLGHRLVVLGPGVVDGALLLLDGLVDLVEGGLHRVGRVHVLQHELLHLDADAVEVAEPLQLLLGLERDLLAADGQDLVDAVVAHHLAHGGLGHVAERLGHVAHVEQVLARVLDPVLDDPLDHRDVQVAGEHQRLAQRLRRVGGELGARGGPQRCGSRTPS